MEQPAHFEYCPQGNVSRSSRRFYASSLDTFSLRENTRDGRGFLLRLALHLILVSTLCVSNINALLFSNPKKAKSSQIITIAILAKDKAHVLPLYLACIENQTWPKEKTNLYIRTNNNNDETTNMLKRWIKKVFNNYHEVYFDDTDVSEPVQQYGQHEWNGQRFKVLGAIRQASLDWAHEHNSHYFVCDCDNFIVPETLEMLYKTNLPIVAPLLHSADTYSNYHADIDENGYYKRNDLYYPLLYRRIKGLVEVPVVHCTYFIRHGVLPNMCYNDESGRHEYVIFSDTARKKDIPQYLDTRKVYGRLTFAENYQELMNEPWINDFHIPNISGTSE